MRLPPRASVSAAANIRGERAVRRDEFQRRAAPPYIYLLQRARRYMRPAQEQRHRCSGAEDRAGTLHHLVRFLREAPVLHPIQKLWRASIALIPTPPSLKRRGDCRRTRPWRRSEPAPRAILPPRRHFATIPVWRQRPLPLRSQYLLLLPSWSLRSEEIPLNQLRSSGLAGRDRPCGKSLQSGIRSQENRFLDRRLNKQKLGKSG